MSYVLGWKTRSNVYIAADSVTTTTPIPVSVQSNFGERQICEGGTSVAERALKIVVDGDLAIGLCGDFGRARELAGSVFQSYKRHREPEIAMREMIASNGPFPMHHAAQLVVAWRGEPCPRLFSFNHDQRGTLREFGDGEGVPLGSIRAMHKSMTQDLFKRLFVVESEGSAAYLTAALGVLQSFGIHDYLIDDGVGGVFTGLSVSRDAISWQPDLLYLIDEPGKDIWSAVATCVRDHHLIVNSTITNEPRVYATSVTSEYDLAQWSNQWARFAQSYIKNKQFDFVVLLGLKRWVVVVIEMRRATDSKMVRFNVDSASKDGVAWFELNTEMITMLRQSFQNPEPDARDFRFGFIPFEGR